MLFKDIPGNTSIKNELITATTNNRVAHAQLFSGNRGSAKLALAISYARYLNCNNRQEKESCEKCSSCLKYNTLSHPDLHFIFPIIKRPGTSVALSDNFIKEWRKFILKNIYGSLNDWVNIFEVEKKTREEGFIYTEEVISIHKKIALKNFEANFRVFLIWMPEKMALQTSNRLLKLLEEPPSKTIFLLVSENPTQLLPTISSRLQKTKANNVTIDDMIWFLKNKNIDKERINNIIKHTNTDLGKTIQLLENRYDIFDLFDIFSSWMRLIYKMDIVNISIWVDSIFNIGRKQQKMFLSYSIKMIRECLIFNFANKSLLKINKNELNFISKFSSFIHEENSVIIFEELEKGIKLINRNANAKILFFELSLKMAKFLKVKRRFAIK